ncbi:MAG: hypothetical protein ACFE9M_09740 [Promethearchaeota archaeon]
MLITCSLFYINRGRKKESEHEKILMYGFASFWFSIALARSFFYFSDYFLEATYTGDLITIIETFDIVNYTFLYFYLYIFFYMLINVISLSLIFIWFSIKLKQEFQSLSSVMAVGFTIFLIGWVFEATIIKSLKIIHPAIPPILVIGGALIAISPLVTNLEFFSKGFTNWFVLVSIICILVFLGLTSFTNLPLFVISLVIIMISSFILIMVIIYIVINVVKKVRTPESPALEKSGELKDFLKIFSKPKAFTKEEINFYIEKKICLVCKSKISRLNYVCPGCEVLYCVRCSEALINLENACWVCETPLNELKSKQEGGDKNDFLVV